MCASVPAPEMEQHLGEERGLPFKERAMKKRSEEEVNPSLSLFHGSLMNEL